MKSKITVMVCMAVFLLAATACGQSDTGTPDTVTVSKISFAAPPWPAQISMPIHIFSDDSIAGFAVGLRPITPDSLPFTDLVPNSYTHASSPFNSASNPLWAPFRYDGSTNAGLVGWLNLGLGGAGSPQGEMFTLVMNVDNPDIPVGTVVLLDTLSLDSGGLQEIQYLAGGLTAASPIPWRSDASGDIVLAVEERNTPSLPTSYTLEQNVPNPFNPETQIDFSIPKSGHVHIEIYNTLGQKVKTLVNEPLAVGNKRVSWDGRDDRGKEVASGVYFYKMSVNDFSATKKMLLLK